ncbi:MAG: ureidoglycolate lyase [Usitatibacter sp.]
MRRIEARAIGPAAFAPYGLLIDPEGVMPETINAGTSRRHPELASLDLRAPDRDPVLGIYVAQARRFPLRIERLERHRQAAQAFLPLGMHRFIVVVAPGAEAPDWRGIEAFVTSPGQGVSLNRGCWHHGLIALGDGDRFAVIEGGNYREDTKEAAAPEMIELVT